MDEILQGKPYPEASEAEKENLAEVFGARYRNEFRRANFREVLGVLLGTFHRSGETGKRGS